MAFHFVPDPASEFSPEYRKYCRDLLYLGWTNEEIIQWFVTGGRFDHSGAQRLLQEVLGRMMAYAQRPKDELRAIVIQQYRDFLNSKGCTPAMRLRVFRRLEQLLEIEPPRRSASRASQDASDATAQRSPSPSPSTPGRESKPKPPPPLDPPPAAPGDAPPDPFQVQLARYLAANEARRKESQRPTQCAPPQPEPPVGVRRWYDDAFALLVVLVCLLCSRIQTIFAPRRLRWPRPSLRALRSCAAIWRLLSLRGLPAPFP